jgi:hypothetical protein
MDSACAALTVVEAALERILPLVRQLQLEGINCPLTDLWSEVVSKEMRDLVKTPWPENIPSKNSVALPAGTSTGTG